MCGFEIQRMNCDKAYSYNDELYNTFLTGRQELQCSEIYQIPAEEEIRQVSFYAFGNNQTNIKITKLNPSYTSPDDGVIVYNNNYSGEYNGYHTLDTDPIISDGSYYAVTVTVTGTSCDYPAESYNFSDQELKRSYYNNGKGWQDLGDNDTYINIYTRSPDFIDKQTNKEPENPDHEYKEENTNKYKEATITDITETPEEITSQTIEEIKTSEAEETNNEPIKEKITSSETDGTENTEQKENIWQKIMKIIYYFVGLFVRFGLLRQNHLLNGWIRRFF